MNRPAAQARALAAQTVERIYRGRALDDALDELFAQLPDELDSERALVQELVYGAIRWHVQLAPLVHGLLAKPLKDKDRDVAALLEIGLYQLLYMRVAPHAAVNETVAATTALGKDWAKAFVNAVLRRALREIDALRTRITAEERLTFAFPDWLLARLKAAYPNDWQAIAVASNERPPMSLRVNLARATREACATRLAAAGLAAHPVSEVDSALILNTPAPVDAIPGFRDGELSVQDAAAQLAAFLLEAGPGMHVLDACAAPGGKAAHLLERSPDVDLLAVDIDPGRLARVRENFARLGLTGRIVTGDVTVPDRWSGGQHFDRILLDAPCSATGVIRRHPDIRLHREPRDLERLTRTQARLLDALWPLLAPGGKLLYVTCSILPEENDETIAAFCERQHDARVVPLSHPALDRFARAGGRGWQILPGAGGMDGFFYACLAKPA